MVCLTNEAKARVLALISVIPKKLCAVYQYLELPNALSWPAPSRSGSMGCLYFMVKIKPTGPISSSWTGQASIKVNTLAAFVWPPSPPIQVYCTVYTATSVARVSAHSAGAYTATLLVMVNVIKGGGRAPLTLTSQGKFYPHDWMYARKQRLQLCVLCVAHPRGNIVKEDPKSFLLSSYLGPAPLATAADTGTMAPPFILSYSYSWYMFAFTCQPGEQGWTKLYNSKTNVVFFPFTVPCIHAISLIQ
jgi:hypothetical protein